MTPTQRVLERVARFFEQCAGGAPLAMRAVRIARRIEAALKGYPGRGDDRCRGGVVKIDSSQNEAIPADCQMNAPPYIGSIRAAHLPACPSFSFLSASAYSCPK